jgi:hypothetical protein
MSIGIRQLGQNENSAARRPLYRGEVFDKGHPGFIGHARISGSHRGQQEPIDPKLM